nr:DUF6515 family protein [Flavobacterium humidisoli]
MSLRPRGWYTETSGGYRAVPALVGGTVNNYF